MTIERAAPTMKNPKEIPLGTTFVYGDHRVGPYLKVNKGWVDLRLNYYFKDEDLAHLPDFKEVKLKVVEI